MNSCQQRSWTWSKRWRASHGRTSLSTTLLPATAEGVTAASEDAIALEVDDGCFVGRRGPARAAKTVALVKLCKTSALRKHTSKAKQRVCKGKRNCLYHICVYVYVYNASHRIMSLLYSTRLVGCASIARTRRDGEAVAVAVLDALHWRWRGCWRKVRDGSGDRCDCLVQRSCWNGRKLELLC